MLTTDPIGVGIDPTPSVTSIGVVIPARNEAERIGVAVEAVIESCRAVGPSCSIVVVDDDSTDETAALSAEALRAHDGPSHVMTVRAGRAATARRIGCEVYSATVADPASAWLLSTDADSVVPVDWIARYIEHHVHGDVAVAGVVDLLDDADGRRVVDRWLVDYGATIAADGSHPHVHAANLGVRLDVFERVGGFRDLERIEDIELWDRIRALGLLPVADAGIVVATSARTSGRVQAGFANAIARLYG